MTCIKLFIDKILMHKYSNLTIANSLIILYKNTEPHQPSFVCCLLYQWAWNLKNAATIE